jgi:hypothetical protein
MRPFNSQSKRLNVFGVLLILAAVFYIVDCVIVTASSLHSEMPWLERGIYAGSPFGFYWTAGITVFAFGYLIFGKDK